MYFSVIIHLLLLFSFLEGFRHALLLFIVIYCVCGYARFR